MCARMCVYVSVCACELLFTKGLIVYQTCGFSHPSSSSSPLPFLRGIGKDSIQFFYNLYPTTRFVVCYYNNAFSARHLDLFLLECVCVLRVSIFCWLPRAPPPPPLMLLLLLLLLKREDIVWVVGWMMI